MKKLLLSILATMAFATMSMAQDVYSAGYYINSNSRQTAAVYKNGTKLYNSNPSEGSSHDCPAVDYYYNNVYWAVNTMNGDGSFNRALIKKNDETYAAYTVNGGSHIYDIERMSFSPRILLVAGCTNYLGFKTAACWFEDSTNPWILGVPYFESEAYGITSCKTTSNDEVAYVCGVQHVGSTYMGVIWSITAGDTAPETLHTFDTGTKIFDIAYYEGFLSVVGSAVVGGTTQLKVWETRIGDGATTELYTLATNSFETHPERTKIYVDEGDVYVVGVTDGYDRLYKNGTQIYNTAAYFTSVAVNSNGVYYSGSSDSNGSYSGPQYGRIWKDGSVLFSPSNCTRINQLWVEEPQCDDNYFHLPFTDGFEMGNTVWPCWTINDQDNNNNYSSSWIRVGDRFEQPASGNYCVEHSWGPGTQEGWLISPRIVIPGSGNIQLSFMTREYDYFPSGTGKYMGVWISTTGTNFTEVWSQSNFSIDWRNVTIDLSSYHNSYIYIAFKYLSPDNWCWCIDDVSVTEVAPTQYTITANANNNAWGTVSGGGTYNSGATCTLTATPASGYEFLYWQKGNTQISNNATYSFIVTESATYTAYFQQVAPTQYTITANANNNAWGTVTGGGTYNSGATCTLTATPNSGYEFLKWTKNGAEVSTSPTYSFTVTENASYTAVFGEPSVTYYTISTNVSPAGAGSVEGAGVYPQGTTTYLTATANNGWQFSHWNDGITTNPRNITITGDATYTAHFVQQSFTITVAANPPQGGTVSGGGNYPYGATATLTATPNSGYQFQGWSDGSTQNPHQVTVTSNANYTAIFSEVGTTYYTVSANVTPANAGIVGGTGAYPAGTTITLMATANEGYTFSHWNDGITSNPRTITVNSDLNFTANFITSTYTITVTANPSNGGTVTGGGSYHYGQTAILTATPASGYLFIGWSDGSTELMHSVTVTGNATYTATFSQGVTTYYSVNLICNETEGTVVGGGFFEAGTTTTIQAIPNEGYIFDKWSDGSEKNTRNIVVNSDITLAAFFKGTGVDEDETTPMALYPNPANTNIRIVGIESNTKVEIYNSLGVRVKTLSVGPDQGIDISELAAGFYMMRCGNVTLRFVKMQ